MKVKSWFITFATFIHWPSNHPPAKDNPQSSMGDSLSIMNVNILFLTCDSHPASDTYCETLLKILVIAFENVTFLKTIILILLPASSAVCCWLQCGVLRLVCAVLRCDDANPLLSNWSTLHEAVITGVSKIRWGRMLLATRNYTHLIFSSIPQLYFITLC